ncbi:MAG: zinc ribbon domain-containing protein [Methanobrevibacter sp.]|jgi:hypothetical protein|nr:zinc ribbon domain-containing protein [Methanobrevibacter sp.]
MGKICPYCGCENQNSFNFCFNCGKILYPENENKEGLDYKKLIIISYILTIAFSWSWILFKLIFNSFGFVAFIGLFLPFYLIQSNNPIAKKHGLIQIAISLIGIILSFFNIINFL